MTATVMADLRVQVLSAFLAGEAISRTCPNLRITEDLYRQILVDAGFPDRGRVERARDGLLEASSAPSVVAPVRPRPAPPQSPATQLAVSARALPGLVDVAVVDLDVDPQNVRGDLGDIHGLAMSIQSVGLLQPIVARRTERGRLVIVAGHRRHAAVQMLGWTHVPVLVRKPMRSDEVLAAMLVENGQRANLDPIEEARALMRLKQQRGWSVRDLAAQLGWSQTTIDGRLALLDLSVEDQEALRSGEMNLGDAVRRGRVAAGRVRSAGITGSPHLGVDHDLARLAKARCTRLEHRRNGRNSVGGVACGACWESVIRADERRHLAAHAASTSQCPTCGQEACQ